MKRSFEHICSNDNFIFFKYIIIYFDYRLLINIYEQYIILTSCSIMWNSVIPTDIMAGPKAYNIQPSVAMGQRKHACAVK